VKPLDKVPHLELVPTDQVRFHEHPERNRTLKLVQRLREEAILRSPPIVARLRPDAYILLDGANRVSAFVELGFSHVPVQVIDYGSQHVQLKGWHHLLLEGRALGLRSAYERLPGVRLQHVERAELGTLLELRRVFAVLVDETAACWALFPATDAGFDLRTWVGVLDAVVSAYEGRTALERIKMADYDDLPDVFRSIEHQLVLVPPVTKTELLRLVDEGMKMPTGLTRHLIPGRALGLNLELAFLRQLGSAAEKEQHFRSFVEKLEVLGRIRFYEESVFIMNE
jgi:hypothetical protein